MKKNLWVVIYIFLIPVCANASLTRVEDTIGGIWIETNIINYNFDVSPAFEEGFLITAAGIDLTMTDHSKDNYLYFRWELWSENDAVHFVRRTETEWNLPNDIFAANFTFPLQLNDITPLERLYIRNERSTWIFLNEATFWVEGEYSSVPVPGAFWLFASGILGVYQLRKRTG